MLKQPQLMKLNLSENLITSASDFNGHPKLVILDLRKNKLTSCVGLNSMPCLEELLLSENEIASAKDLFSMPALKKLEINTNKLTTISDLNELPSLELLDISVNTVANGDCISHLATYKKLQRFNPTGNPFADEMADKLKQEVLFRLYPGVKIKFIGEDEIVEDDLVQWKAERRERLKAQEEAQRAAAEKAARGEVDPPEERDQSVDDDE